MPSMATAAPTPAGSGGAADATGRPRRDADRFCLAPPTVPSARSRCCCWPAARSPDRPSAATMASPAEASRPPSRSSGPASSALTAATNLTRLVGWAGSANASNPSRHPQRPALAGTPPRPDPSGVVHPRHPAPVGPRRLRLAQLAARPAPPPTTTKQHQSSSGGPDRHPAQPRAVPPRLPGNAERRRPLVGISSRVARAAAAAPPCCPVSPRSPAG